MWTIESPESYCGSQCQYEWQRLTISPVGVIQSHYVILFFSVNYEIHRVILVLQWDPERVTELFWVLVWTIESYWVSWCKLWESQRFILVLKYESERVTDCYSGCTVTTGKCPVLLFSTAQQPMALASPMERGKNRCLGVMLQRACSDTPEILSQEVSENPWWPNHTFQPQIHPVTCWFLNLSFCCGIVVNL